MKIQQLLEEHEALPTALETATGIIQENCSFKPNVLCQDLYIS